MLIFRCGCRGLSRPLPVLAPPGMHRRAGRELRVGAKGGVSQGGVVGQQDSEGGPRFPEEPAPSAQVHRDLPGRPVGRRRCRGTVRRW